MKSKLTHSVKPSRVTILALSLCAVLSAPILVHAANPATQPTVAGQAQNPLTQPRIQLAILLDTSNSMDGLIDQARNQLWRVVDEFSKARRNGRSARLEVAVFEYGNDRLSGESGYIRKVTDLTGDLDRVSEALFSLTTNGGNEYCGQVIDQATTQLQWSHAEQDIRAIFIAGNEPFSQGPVPYREAVTKAKAAGIVVNTIHAGSYDEGRGSGWQDGALLAGGDYMSIDHNHKIAHAPAPQDARIAELNQALNETYIPFGKQGHTGKQRQLEQDANTLGISPALLAKRAKSKAGSLYSNRQWDLVDATKDDEQALRNLDESELPEEMSGMNLQQREAYVSAKAAEREQIKQEIAELGKARDRFITDSKKQAAEAHQTTVDDALVSSIRKQGQEKDYRFAEE
ncbi:MAG: vWA domain-containing protein [Candidatus Thiodiazotropha sp.]